MQARMGVAIRFSPGFSHPLRRYEAQKPNRQMTGEIY